MKLEFKHLAQYLPYGLKAYHKFEDQLLEREVTLLNVINFVNNDTNAKIALRPLSDLTKEIEHNGEKFLPLNKMTPYSTSRLNMDKWDKDVSDMPFIDVQKLFEWHFDVFGLIPEGLAIDINTLK